MASSEESLSKRSFFASKLGPMLLKNAPPLSPSSSPWERIVNSFLCPPHGWLAQLLTYVLAIVTIWGVSYSILGQIALPGQEIIEISIQGGTVFSLVVLVVVALIGGWIMSLMKLPPLLGMLLVGILLRNIPVIKEGMGIDPPCAGALRSLALVIILLRAGLGMDPSALKKLSLTVFLLALSPCVIETIAVAVTSHYLLDFPWTWGFMLGFILAAVSPAVVVPCLLNLQERGYGVAKGIPTLVMSAASLNDVLAISAFTIILSITFHPGNNLTSTILQGPLEALIGVLWGMGWGGLATFFPSQPSTGWRVLLLVGGGLLALFGSEKVGLPGAGALAVLVMGFTAGVGWRFQGWTAANPVSKVLFGFWIICEPLLFGLIGTEIRLDSLVWDTVGWGVVIVGCGSFVRLLVTYPSLLKGGLTRKEKLFVDLAWLPKATVQAALGPKALDLARKALDDAGSYGLNEAFNNATTTMDPGDNENELRVKLGQEILTIAVLVILITAPIGAVAIMTSGPRLLQSSHKQTEDLQKNQQEINTIDI